jgi:hypothetical protein
MTSFPRHTRLPKAHRFCKSQLILNFSFWMYSGLSGKVTLTSQNLEGLPVWQPNPCHNAHFKYNDWEKEDMPAFDPMGTMHDCFDS